MTDRERATYIKQINDAQELNVFVPEVLISEDKIRGIYGFFKTKDEKEECFYVGKSNDIRSRIIGRSGHITYVLKGKPNTKITKEIVNLLANDYMISLRVLKSVPYDFTKSFAYNANSLCLEELKVLVDKQGVEECDEQFSEAVKLKAERADWDKDFMDWSDCGKE